MARQGDFVQLVIGHVAEGGAGRAEIREMLDRWSVELAPGATGWLGTTAGVADDGTFVASVRFASPELARENSDRPEQHQWWMETAKLFAGDVTFHDCPDAEEYLRGGSDDAGFVQVVEARLTDVEAVRLAYQRLGALAAAGTQRTDLIGGIGTLHDGDRSTMVMYYTSESAARDGRRWTPPPPMAALLAEIDRLSTDISRIDLREPWFYTPG